ncbi:oxidoreductase [Galbitalea soli]|uniref:SDR family NAD(P)-dependent oxidoreductase n=1 Tax=Galbitalea soli TaxID=1268042 RepID=A0A7C9PMB8_9MICO|nr:oxidoreductase [Galbitalea soli]NEM90785.1 SDR family NAD(P)-dependent oxidoreductase [Galbitalea soli]NYJ31503.1 protochlorophyllide reductase [Galbitalea soli]
MTKWNETDVPDQTGRTALVTGATGGLGLRVAEVLASRGARVLMTSRNAERGAAARDRVAAVATGPEPEIIGVDLSDLTSVGLAAATVRDRTGDRLDLLVNNAGIMAPPRAFSVDGFESQWATNVFGPAALTWQLLPAIRETPRARVVFVSSIAHFGATFDASRLQKDARGDDYVPFAYYGRTKLADLLLSRELERHFLRSESAAISVAAHPGFSSTNLISSTVEGRPAWQQDVTTRIIGATGQSVAMGALPLLYAATADGVRGSQYFGPRGLFETRGYPHRAARTPASRSDALGRWLLDFVQEKTGVTAPR